jgi:hypothetical protein
MQLMIPAKRRLLERELVLLLLAGGIGWQLRQKLPERRSIGPTFSVGS